MDRKSIIKILKLLEVAYPKFYYAEKLRKEVGLHSLDGEFSQILRYLKDTGKIDIVLPESRIAPTGRYKLDSWLMGIDEITITPKGIDYLTKLKLIETNRKRNETTKLATIVMAIVAVISLVTTIFFNYQIFNLQKESSPTISPNIEVALTNGYARATFHLASIQHNQDGSFNHRDNTLNFKVVNNGQRPTGYMNFYIIDEDKTYKARKGYEEFSLNPLSHGFIQLYLWHQNCSSYGDDFDTVYERCEEGRREIKNGLRTFTLLLDCPGCAFEKENKCYKLNICVYNDSSTDNLCDEIWKQEYSDLPEISCPINWRSKI